MVLLCNGAELIFIVGAGARPEVLRDLFAVERALDVTHVSARGAAAEAPFRT